MGWEKGGVRGNPPDKLPIFRLNSLSLSLGPEIQFKSVAEFFLGKSMADARETAGAWSGTGSENGVGGWEGGRGRGSGVRVNITHSKGEGSGPPRLLPFSVEEFGDRQQQPGR